MKKILVLGANGMAGHLIALYLIEKGYDVTGFTTAPIEYCKNIVGNAFNQSYFKQTIIKGQYDVVINCIGILNKDADDNKSSAVYLNAYLPHYIADVLRNLSTKLIHMSTDCVFAGNTGPYFEDSFRDGKTFYDRTKAIGEVDDSKNLTFRNSIIGPDINEKGIGLFNWFMKQYNTIEGFNGALWTGVTTLTLAKAMEQAIQENLCGLYNLVNNESISKYDLLCLFNKHFKNNQLKINKNISFNLDKSLRRKRNDFSFIVPSYEEMIIDMKEWILNHSDLYPLYV